ncbi:MAG: hypothetical protein ACREUT_21290 [Steroidobacteraceae bacterium]
MEIGVEISLYPLEANFAPRIKAFLDRLRAAGRLKIVTTSLSTQLFGEYDEVVAALTREMRAVFAEGGTGESAEGAGKAVFLVKLFGPLAPPRA